MNQKEIDLIYKEEFHEMSIDDWLSDFDVDEYLTEIEREEAEDRAWEEYSKE